MAKGFTLQDFQKRFPDDDACLDHLMTVRFGKRIECPKCGKTGTFARIKKIPAYSCPSCGHHVHPMQGTPFAKTHTALSKWFYAMWLFTTSRHGVSAKELQRQLGVTYKTAWRMGHEIRKYMGAVDGDDGLSGHVEIDETYVGGKHEGARGRRNPKKAIVFGMAQRAGRIITRVVKNAGSGELIPHVVQKIARGSRVSSDQWLPYRKLGRLGYQHGMVDHGAEEWVRGDIHTNSIEGFWAILKRSIRSTHIHVSRHHLPKYLGEFEFRHNLRKSPHLMFAKLLASF